MPKCYWVANVEVTDADVYGNYASVAKEAIESHGGRFPRRPPRATRRPRPLTQRCGEFPSSVAQACYNSELYQKAVGFSSQCPCATWCWSRGSTDPAARQPGL